MQQPIRFAPKCPALLTAETWEAAPLFGLTSSLQRPCSPITLHVVAHSLPLVLVLFPVLGLCLHYALSPHLHLSNSHKQNHGLLLCLQLQSLYVNLFLLVSPPVMPHLNNHYPTTTPANLFTRHHLPWLVLHLARPCPRLLYTEQLLGNRLLLLLSLGLGCLAASSSLKAILTLVHLSLQASELLPLLKQVHLSLEAHTLQLVRHSAKPRLNLQAELTLLLYVYEGQVHRSSCTRAGRVRRTPSCKAKEGRD